MGHKPIGDNLKPASIERQAKSAQDNIESPTWSSVKDDDFKPPDYDVRAAKDVSDVNLVDYNCDVAWEDIYDPLLTKRTDPALYTVEKLEVRPGIAAVAYKQDKTDRRGFGDMRSSGARSDRDVPSLRPDQTAEFVEYLRGFTGAKVEGKYFVAVTGQVPYAKQVAEYDRCFRNAAGYLAERDVPHYYWFTLERAELAEDGTYVDQVLKDGSTSKWKEIASPKIARLESQTWASSVPEVVETAYVDQAVTMPIPPLLGIEYTSLATHSDIPLKKSDRELANERLAETRGGEEDVSGMGPGPGPGERPKEPKEEEKEEVKETAEIEQADFRLFRYFDFNVDPRKKYQYRVKLYLWDPNDPPQKSSESDSRELSDAAVFTPPKDADLHRTVIERLAERKKANSRYWRETGDLGEAKQYSDASAKAAFPPRETAVAVDVTPDRMIAIRDYGAPADEGFEIRDKERRADVMLIRWDPTEAAWIPGVVKDVLRGGMLEGVIPTWKLDSQTLSLRDMPDYAFPPQGFVVDIAGGEELPKPADRRKAEEMFAPGEILVINDDWSLSVCDEVEQATEYRKFCYGPLLQTEDEDEGPSSRSRPRDDEGGGPLDDTGALDGI